MHILCTTPGESIHRGTGNPADCHYHCMSVPSQCTAGCCVHPSACTCIGAQRSLVLATAICVDGCIPTPAPPMLHSFLANCGAPSSNLPSLGAFVPAFPAAYMYAAFWPWLQVRGYGTSGCTWLVQVKKKGHGVWKPRQFSAVSMAGWHWRSGCLTIQQRQRDE